MISTELAENILGGKVKRINDNTYKNSIVFLMENDDIFKLNIYELAHMVKEWARGYFSISSYPTYYGYGASLTDAFGNSPKNLIVSKNTEPEAIIEAGQYILNITRNKS